MLARRSGSHETLSNITLEKVQEYIEDNYKPEHTTIVVVGDFDLKDARKLTLMGLKVLRNSDGSRRCREIHQVRTQKSESSS